MGKIRQRLYVIGALIVVSIISLVPRNVKMRVRDSVSGAMKDTTVRRVPINLAPPDSRKLLPPDGVYAVRVKLKDGRVFGGMMNQGPRPTFGEQARTLEAHLFDFDGELYGETVDVEWVRRLREVQAFPSRDALVAQLERDRQAARATLNR